jgi:hypothetical protein
MGIGSTLGLATAAQALVQLASSGVAAPARVADSASALTPSTVVTISQAAQDQIAQGLLSGESTQLGASFGELAQALILALMLQLLENKSAA